MGWMSRRPLQVPHNAPTSSGVPLSASVYRASTSQLSEHAQSITRGSSNYNQGGVQASRKQPKRKNVDDFSQHYNFLKQRKLTSHVQGHGVNREVKSVQCEMEDITQDTVTKVGERYWNVEELWSVVEELEEVALTLVYSDGSTQLSKAKVGDRLMHKIISMNHLSMM